jgi:hypothetical protein
MNWGKSTTKSGERSFIALNCYDSCYMIHEGHSLTVHGYMKSAYMVYTGIWKACTHNIQIYGRYTHTLYKYMKTVPIKYTVIWKLYTYNVRIYERHAHTGYRYLKVMRIQHMNILKVCAYDIRIFSKASDRCSLVREVEQSCKFDHGLRDTTPWSECSCHYMVVLTH